MDGPHHRDIDELLTYGFFKTARGKSPSSSTPTSTSAPYNLQATEPHRHRSRSRETRKPPPPSPTAEDEAISLSRESPVFLPSYDPPLRGIIDQNPIILEAEVTQAEAARLQKIPCTKEDSENAERRFVFTKKKEENPERRFVLIPQDEPTKEKPKARRTDERLPAESTPDRPQLHKRHSRQDLPSLETRVPRELPPQFRRSVSATSLGPKDEGTPKSHVPRTPSGEYFLSPDAMRGKEYFPQTFPRHQDNQGRGTPIAEKRSSGSYSGSRPATPEKRNSSDSKGRSRRGTNEKMNRTQLAEEVRRQERHGSTHSDRYEYSDRFPGLAAGLAAGVAAGVATGRSSRSSHHSKKCHSSSDDDESESDREKYYRRRQPGRLKREELGQRSSSKASLEPQHTSRRSSPLPSPLASPGISPRHNDFERAETFPRRSERPSSRPQSPVSGAPQVNRMNPVEAPKLRQSSTAPQPKTTAPYPESLPIPIPDRIDLSSPGETRRSPAIPNFDNSPRAAQSHWQPPPFQPPAHLDKPVGSNRRLSQDIQRGSIAPLPTCSRTFPVRGKNDWLTLPNCPNFDICPSCFANSIAPTDFRHLFVPSPRRHPDFGVVCDFGTSPWYRIAWLLTLKEKRRDLKLFASLADIADNFQPCLGKEEAVRDWHSIVDPKTGNAIRGFGACYTCVKSVEILLPAVRGVFVRTETHRRARICDLRFDSKRFVQYFDALETAADKAMYDDTAPDTRPLANLARRLTMFDECEQDTDLIERRWHIITQLPEFTVCEECFDQVVWPELDEGKAIPLMFAKEKKRMPKASCQLYSPRMRGIFRQAVDSNDYKMLAAKARERKTVELAYKAHKADLRRDGGETARREMRRVEEDWERLE